MSALAGGCRCGAVRYAATVEPVASGTCHCRDCQYASGGGPAYVLLVPRAGFAITKGTPRAYESLSDAGNRVVRHFCADCGTPLFSERATGPFAAVRAGSLDDPSRYKPGGNIWVGSAQPWHHIDPALPHWDKGPG
jgi:hypothetical protein